VAGVVGVVTVVEAVETSGTKSKVGLGSVVGMGVGMEVVMEDGMEVGIEVGMAVGMEVGMEGGVSAVAFGNGEGYGGVEVVAVAAEGVTAAGAAMGLVVTTAPWGNPAPLTLLTGTIAASPVAFVGTAPTDTFAARRLPMALAAAPSPPPAAVLAFAGRAKVIGKPVLLRRAAASRSAPAADGRLSDLVAFDAFRSEARAAVSAGLPVVLESSGRTHDIDQDPDRSVALTLRMPVSLREAFCFARKTVSKEALSDVPTILGGQDGIQSLLLRLLLR